MALDVCQLSRGVVDSRCHLPGKVVMAALAMKAGLFEGALWCDGDYGHAQVGISAEACRRNLYAAVKRFRDTLTGKPDDSEDEAKVYDYTKVAALDIADPDAKAPRRQVSKRRATRTYAARRHHRYARHRHVTIAAYARPNQYDMRWGAGQ